jgi:hypothetical protein
MQHVRWTVATRTKSRGDLQSAVRLPQVESEKRITPTAEILLAHSLAREIEKCPDLARLIDAWPTLPATLKAAVLAVIALARQDV